MITEAQRQERKNYIGGSDIPIILGLSPYKTPYQLFLEKKGLAKDSYEENESMYWGSIMEPVLREEFAKRNKVIVEEPTEAIEHPLFPFLKGNVDGWIPELNAVWEGKTAGSYMAYLWGDERSDAIPFQYLVQVAFYCAVTNSSTAYISVLLGGNNYREYIYRRDSDLEDKIIDGACRFWNLLQKNEPPAPSNVVDLKLMFPRHDPGKVKTINSDIAEELTELQQIRLAIKGLEKAEEKARFNIMEYLEDNECLTNENDEALVTWKSSKNGQRRFVVREAK